MTVDTPHYVILHLDAHSASLHGASILTRTPRREMSVGRSGTLRTASGRQVRKPKESEVVDILSRYADDSDEDDDSEDEDYTARSSYSESQQTASCVSSSHSALTVLPPCCGAHSRTVGCKACECAFNLFISDRIVAN